jgi:hypothetical protein
MKFMLLTYLDEKAWLALSEAEQKALMDECAPHVERLQSSGKLLAGAPLHPTSTARTVSRRNGKTLVTAGPFAETREQLGGYSILEAASMDEAVELASGFYPPGSRDGISRIEVRPIVEFPGLASH